MASPLDSIPHLLEISQKFDVPPEVAAAALVAFVLLAFLVTAIGAYSSKTTGHCTCGARCTARIIYHTGWYADQVWHLDFAPTLLTCMRWFLFHERTQILVLQL